MHHSAILALSSLGLSEVFTLLITATPATAKYIDSAKDLALMAHYLSREKSIAFDTEFLWERTYAPKLALIQVANFDACWVVDTVALNSADIRPLLDVFTASNTLKVGHAVEQDQLCLKCTYNIIAEPVLDTSIGAALVGLGDQIGLSGLLSKLLRINIDKGYSRTNWMKRPLPKEMLNYAANDVIHLSEAADKLIHQLQDLNRLDWAMELSAKFGKSANEAYDPAPLALKLSSAARFDVVSFSILKELLLVREDLARQKDIPRKWMADDKMLLKLASARPKNINRIKEFRGLGALSTGNGPARILAAIERGRKSPAEDYCPVRKLSPSASEAATLNILKCFLNVLAADNKIPLRYLIESNDLLTLLRGNFKQIEELRNSGFLEPHVLQIIGNELVEILNGRRILRVVNGQGTQEHV